MNPLKNIKLDIDRIVLQLFIPGFFSVVPFFILFVNTIESAKDYFLQSASMCSALIIILSLAAGLILENFGSLIEFQIDKINKNKYLKENRDTDAEWNEYLKLNLPPDCGIIAQRYLKTIIIRMKFELSFCVSLIIMTIGMVFLNLKIEFIDNWTTFTLLCIVLPVSLALYLLWEAKNSSELMVKQRKNVLESLNNSK